MNSNITPENNSLSGFQIIKTAVLDTNKHFTGSVSYTSFPLLLVICIFVPLWVWYIKTVGLDHEITTVFELNMYCFFLVVITFTVSLFLFNKTHPPSSRITFWKFTKEVSWPWLVEGLKSFVIIIGALFLLIIPGIIKVIHYIFLSFVVFFNKDYKEGKINALKHSKKLSKGLGWWLFFLICIVPYFITKIPHLVVKSIFSQTDSLFIIYPLLILSLYICCMLSTYLCSVLYFMYTAREQQIDHPLTK